MPAVEKGYSRDFERDVLPYLDDAKRLARWLTQSETDAQDIVQEAYLRAFRFFGCFEGGQPRAWILKIVRNCCYTWMLEKRMQPPTAEVDHDFLESSHPAENPLNNFIRSEDLKLFREGLEALPTHLRTVLLLREFEGLSYKQISEVIRVPTGTVMSRLHRARVDLRESLSGQLNGTICHWNRLEYKSERKNGHNRECSRPPTL